MTAAEAVASPTIRARIQCEAHASPTTVLAELRGQRPGRRASAARERIRLALERAGVDLATIPQTAGDAPTEQTTRPEAAIVSRPTSCQTATLGSARTPHSQAREISTLSAQARD